MRSHAGKKGERERDTGEKTKNKHQQAASLFYLFIKMQQRDICSISL